MPTVKEQAPTKTLDIWLVFVIILMVLSIGGGMWITGKSIIASLDELAIRTTNKLSNLEVTVFQLQKQIQDLTHEIKMNRKDRESASETPKPAPTP